MPISGSRCTEFPYYSGTKSRLPLRGPVPDGDLSGCDDAAARKGIPVRKPGEMLAFFRKRFGAKTSAQERVVDEYVAPMIRKQGNEMIISGDSTFAHIRWKKERS